MTFATFVLLARERLGLSDAGFGFLLISGAVGGLLATPFAPRLIRRIGAGSVMVTSLWVFAATPLLVPFTHSPVVVGVYFALTAAFGITWNVATVSLRQRIIPDRLFGRVNSVYRLLAWGTMPIGAAIGGFVADQYGLVAPYWIAVAVMAVAAVWFSFRLGNAHVRAAEADAVSDR
jgi:predicted MFS family arabinose efflux permease